MVKALADSAGISAVQTAQIAQPAYALEDHWNDGQARRVITAGGWTHVVMQEGASSELATRVYRPGGFSVWPALANFSDFEASIESSRLAAEPAPLLQQSADEANGRTPP